MSIKRLIERLIGPKVKQMVVRKIEFHTDDETFQDIVNQFNMNVVVVQKPITQEKINQLMEEMEALDK